MSNYTVQFESINGGWKNHPIYTNVSLTEARKAAKHLNETRTNARIVTDSGLVVE